MAARRCSATTRQLTTLSLLARLRLSPLRASRLTTGNGLALKTETRTSKQASAKILFRFRPVLLLFFFTLWDEAKKKTGINLVVSDLQERLSVGHSGDSC